MVLVIEMMMASIIEMMMMIMIMIMMMVMMRMRMTKIDLVNSDFPLSSPMEDPLGCSGPDAPSCATASATNRSPTYNGNPDFSRFRGHQIETVT